MKCTECQGSIQSYLGDELEEQRRAELEFHLAECSDCGCKVTDRQKCLSWLRKAFPEQAPPTDLWEDLQAKTKTQ
jgi:hypothetical protein